MSKKLVVPGAARCMASYNPWNGLLVSMGASLPAGADDTVVHHALPTSLFKISYDILEE